MNYYIVKMQAKQRIWLAGPFACREQAEVKKSLFDDFNTSACPCEFITPRQTDNGPGFIMIAPWPNQMPTWFGDCLDELIPHNVI